MAVKADMNSRPSFFNPTRSALLETFALDEAMVRGSGFRLFDAQGREYLDFLSQYGALPFGHNPPELWEAMMSAQGEQMPSMIQPLRPVEAERLAARLARLAPGDLEICTFANSGAETVEAAIKLARARTGRDLILSATNGFHGKTLGALSATGKPLYQIDFAAPAPGFEYVPYGDIDALAARLKADAGRIAAFMFEPIQGEGGVVCPPDGYLDAAIALCRQHGVLSIVDEIQTGLGRTGALFVSAAASEPPDMLLLAKALGGGMIPIGACIVRPDVWDDRFGLLHSSTFANNNLACRVASATLDLLERDDRRIIRDVAANGAYLLGRLRELQERHPETIRDVRGRGYMTGLEFARFDGRDDSATMAFCSLNRGVTPLFSSYLFNVHRVLTAPLFNESHVLRLQPPLIAGPAEIDRAVDALGALCAAIERRNYHEIVKHLVDDRPRAEASHREPQKAPAESRRKEPTRSNTFAFLLHYTEEDDVLHSDPSFRNFSEEGLSDWRSWVKRLGPGFIRAIPNVRSKSGASAEGWIMSVPMLPGDMRGKSRATAVEMIESAVDLAAERGILALRARCLHLHRDPRRRRRRRPWCADHQRQYADDGDCSAQPRAGRRAGRPRSRPQPRRGGRCDRGDRAPRRADAGPAGRRDRSGGKFRQPLLEAAAAGGVRRALRNTGGAAHALHRRVERADRGDGLASRDHPVRRGGDVQREAGDSRSPRASRAPSRRPAGIRRSSAPPTSTRRSAPPTWCWWRRVRRSPWSIPGGCARARCSATSRARRTWRRPTSAELGVLAYDGGLVRPPSPIDLGPMQTLPTNLCWGCLGETMLLALEDEIEDYSIGGKLCLRQADYIAALANKHGFEPAEPQWYGTLLTDGDFTRVAAKLPAQLRLGLQAKGRKMPRIHAAE